jgi:hypothetical protein
MDSGQRDAIVSSLNALIGISERLSDFLRRRRHQVRVAKAVLTGLLIWAGLSAVAIGTILTLYPPTFFFENRDLLFALAFLLLLIGLGGGAASYFLVWKEAYRGLDELSELIAKMKTADKGGTTSESALSFAEKLFTLLPQIVRKRNQDALLFGVVAFLIATVIGRPPIGIVVGVVVWLYFRYEAGKTYESEISKLEEQRRVFEQRKKDFIENL